MHYLFYHVPYELWCFLSFYILRKYSMVYYANFFFRMIPKWQFVCVCVCVLIVVYLHARITFNIFFRVLDKNDCFRISLSFIVLHSKTTYSTSAAFVLRTCWHESFCVDPGWSTTRTVCISRIKRTTEWATWTAGSKTPTTGWRTTSQRSHRLWRTCTRTWPSRYSTVRWSRSPWPGAANKWAPPSCQVRHTGAYRRIVVFISRKKNMCMYIKDLGLGGTTWRVR